MRCLELAQAVRPELWPLLDDPEVRGRMPCKPTPAPDIPLHVVMQRKKR